MKALTPLRKPLRRLGFTLIEMIGVLAIIAILVAAVAPRIFDAISDSRITAATTSIKSFQSAVAKYYADVGSLYPLAAATGVPTTSTNGVTGAAYAGSLPDALVLSSSAAPASTGTGLWRRFRGPYADGFTTANPPIGTSMTVSAEPCNAAALTALTANFSLANNATSIFPAGTQLVYATFAGVTSKEFDKIDGILDDGIGTTAATRQVWGRVKWNPATGNLMVYIAHH